MHLNRLEGDKIQYVAERKELEHYFDKRVRQILKEEIPQLLKELGKKEWLTKEELMKLTGWSGRTIQHMRDSKQIPYSVKGHEYSPPGVNSIPHLFSELSDSI
jgi:hypothetical protein